MLPDLLRTIANIYVTLNVTSVKNLKKKRWKKLLKRMVNYIFISILFFVFVFSKDIPQQDILDK